MGGKGLHNRTHEYAKGHGLDRHNRLPRIFFLEGEDINVERIKAGLAEFYRGDPSHGLDMTPRNSAPFGIEQGDQSDSANTGERNLRHEVVGRTVS